MPKHILDELDINQHKARIDDLKQKLNDHLPSVDSDLYSEVYGMLKTNEINVLNQVNRILESEVEHIEEIISVIADIA